MGVGAPRGQGTGPARTPRRARVPHLHRYRLAGVGGLRPRQRDRRTGADHRRRQHRHGLLSHVSSAGRRDIKVMARRPRRFFKASPWELDDAEEEGVEIMVNYAPTRFVVDDGRLVGHGVRRTRVGRGRAPLHDRRHGRHPVRRRDSRDRPGERLPVDRAGPRHDLRRVGHAGRRRGDDAVERARRVLRRRRGLRAQEHHLGRRARSPGGDLHRQLLPRGGPDGSATGRA